MFYISLNLPLGFHFPDISSRVLAVAPATATHPLSHTLETYHAYCKLLLSNLCYLHEPLEIHSIYEYIYYPRLSFLSKRPLFFISITTNNISNSILFPFFSKNPNSCQRKTDVVSMVLRMENGCESHPRHGLDKMMGWHMGLGLV